VSAHSADQTFVLAERSDGFNYEYRMQCACGETSALAAGDYFAEARRARMDCAHCGKEIHFGPAVAALRDENDPALQDNLVSTFAWYHTSTSPDWPSPDYAAQFENRLKWVERDFGISRDNYLAQQTSKALHVGTYEAAIENMLRRMENQDDGTKQFYLYRVALRLTPGRINPGYRDEITPSRRTSAWRRPVTPVSTESAISTCMKGWVRCPSPWRRAPSPQCSASPSPR